MASNENAVFLSPHGTCIRKEAVGAGAISPAMLLERDGETVKALTLTEGDVKQVLVADLGTTYAGALGTVYNDNDVVNFKAPFEGMLVRLYVGASTTIVVGDEIASKGAGAVGTPAAAGVGVIGYARTAVTTGAGESGYVTVEIL